MIDRDMESSGETIKIHTNPTPIDIFFQNITYSVSLGGFKRERKPILKGVSGYFKSGKLTAILGPSGAGKTTLLNILTGFHEANVGGFMIVVDHSNGVKRSSLRRKDTSYIFQEDDLSPFFTVEEIMMIAANLKLGETAATRTKQKIIEGILNVINLSKAKETRCAKLSGGEKKRLVIALELINNPPVMFLDEPTTGLDSVSCHQCITILKNLAKGGRNIICTIHQPSALVFEMFDHVYVLAEGKCVYQGTPHNVIPSLQSISLHCPQYHNPADFIIEVANGDYGQFNPRLVAIAYKQCWRTTSLCTETTTLNPSNGKCINNSQAKSETEKFSEFYVAPAEYQRFVVLLKKCALKLHRDWMMSYLRVAVHLSVGIFMGLLFGDFGGDASKVIPNLGFLITTLMYQCYTSMMSAILKFPTELNVIKKEHFNNWYKLITFYLAFIIVNIPLQIIFTIIYVVPAYYLTSQIRSYERFLKFSLVCLFVNLLSEAIGLFFGTSFTTVNGVFLGSIFACFCFLFSGYFLLFPHIPKPLYYVSHSSYLRYATSAAIQTIYGNHRKPLDCPKSEIYCIFKYPQEILKFFGVENDEYFISILILFCFIILAYVISFFSLRRRIRNK